MKRFIICLAMVQFALFAFAQNFNAPRSAEKLLTANKQNVKTIMVNIGFKNVTAETKAVEEAGGRVLTIYSAFHKGISPKCDVCFDERRTPAVVSMQYIEYENVDVLADCYKKAGFTLVGQQTKPAYMNKEQRDRMILRWEKKTKTGTIVCLSEIADVVHENSITLIDLNSSFFKKKE